MKELQAGIRVGEDVVGMDDQGCRSKRKKRNGREKNEIKNIRKEEGKLKKKKKNKEQRKGRMKECYEKKGYITQ